MDRGCITREFLGRGGLVDSRLCNLHSMSVNISFNRDDLNLDSPE